MTDAATLRRDREARIAEEIGAEPASEALDIFREIAAPALKASDFPPVVSDLAFTVARAAGHDPGAYAMAALIAAAGAISDDIRLQIDPRSSWFESVRLWGLLIGLPGSAKTPAIRAAMDPLHEIHRRLHAEHIAAMKDVPKDEQTEARRVFINDATTEKLSEILAADSRGIIAVFEELDTWLGAHDAYRGGQGSKDRGEWLRLFDGGPHQVDRVKRGSFFVKNWGASILGATTPAGLRRHAKDLPPDGLIQRFLSVMVRQPTAADDSILIASTLKAKEAYRDRLCELYEAPAGTVRMSKTAAGIFRARRDVLRDEVAAMAELSEPFAGHLAKHPGLLCRVSLAMHCLDHGAGAIDVELSTDTMMRAGRLLQKLARHGLAMFDALGGSNTALHLARRVASSILADEYTEVSMNTLTQACRAFRDAPEAARLAAVRTLEDAGWLLPQLGRTYRGLPTAWNVADDVHQRFEDQAQRHRAVRRQVFEAFKGAADA